MFEANATQRLQSAIPRKLGKYEIYGLIGRGAMALVYLGYDPFAGRKVALKVSAIREGDEERGRLLRRMFYNEAHMAGLLQHPNILSVYDAGEEDDTPYIVMEHVEGGRTLKEFCSPERLPPVRQVVEIAFKCARALDYAHRMGVIHRDIKPSNIMLTEDGDVRIGDFGVARRIHTDTTQVLGMIGSPRYMSPEQVREEEVSGQTDIYSLGVVLYELLTGRPPFLADEFSRLIYKVLHDEPLPLRELRADVSALLADVVHKAMAKDCRERYRSGNEMAAALAAIFEFLEGTSADIDEEEQFNAVRPLRFFADFSDSELWEVLRAAAWQRYQDDDRIIAEGNLEHSFYIIVSGRVAVRKGDRTLATLGTGDCFGEMGYLAHAQRTASIVAVDAVSVLDVSSTLIDEVSSAAQLKFYKIFVRTLIERLTRTNEALAQT